MRYENFDLSFNRDFRESKTMISVEIRTKNIDYEAEGDHLWKGVTRLTIIAMKFNSFDPSDRSIFQPAPSDPVINGWHLCQRISQINRDSSGRTITSNHLDVPSAQLMIDSYQCAVAIGEHVEAEFLEALNPTGMKNIYKRLGGFDFEHKQTLAKNFDNQTLLAKDLGNGYHLILGEIWTSLDEALAYYKPIFPLTNFTVQKDRADTFIGTLSKGHPVIQKGQRAS